MSKQIYISADYSEYDGDRDVINVLNNWSDHGSYKITFLDMAQVVSGSISADPDCRPCDLKKEFNNQINSSSLIIFIIGDKIERRTAGSNCDRNNSDSCYCTPYKQNSKGTQLCKVTSTVPATIDVGNINTYSYLKHEFEQAKKRNKKIIIIYNSSRKEEKWLPEYMKGYEEISIPFWKYNENGEKVGDYDRIKKEFEIV